MIDGAFESCVMIKSVKSNKGEKLPAKMVILLPGEWDFFCKYFKFVSDFYKLSEKQNSLEVTRQQMAVNGMKKHWKRFEKGNKKRKMYHHHHHHRNHHHHQLAQRLAQRRLGQKRKQQIQKRLDTVITQIMLFSFAFIIDNR